ncbi:hypothetical protein [Haloquadratum walsbyi]|jgi:small-conductance mechanosensitive channel|uniref:Uncharacterized protein n=1 Tax=Haloquadratum walsbyi J07HQW2 TaxID=1238425 RepID=U1PK31_9EURY|nr:hypothetical protein [Haloquadratum walsbyi]ERG94027.1 MAG: hypothetical protein J07HQW2_00461 [Haloquadratum walsbyi J07HQW2]
MQLRNQATVTGYGIGLVGLLTVIQYAGVIETSLSVFDQGVILSGGIVALGVCLMIIGVLISVRPEEIHRGTERAPLWLFLAIAFETVAFGSVAFFRLF